MIEILDKEIRIPRKMWDGLKEDPRFVELIEELEDRVELEKAKKDTVDFTTFRDYDRKRMKNV